MKIEIGENLFYSWLRHVKDCQIVQTNWKTSPQWSFQHQNEIAALMKNIDSHFKNKYHFSVFKQTTSLSQLLQQAECDLIGISLQENKHLFYAIDVAFHEGGLNYGGRDTTVMKVIAKLARTAMCMFGYMDCNNAELIFASPKINSSLLSDLLPCIADLNIIFETCNLNFKSRIIANEEFNSTVLQPILIASQGIADTSELFLRSYQMYTMFSQENHQSASTISTLPKCTSINLPKSFTDESKYKELKIGKIVNIVMRRILENGLVSEEEIKKLQQSDYSKATFDIQYPVLRKSGDDYEKLRYYAQPVYIHGESYYLCSQWYETTANNDRPYLLKWIEAHE